MMYLFLDKRRIPSCTTPGIHDRRYIMLIIPGTMIPRKECLVYDKTRLIWNWFDEYYKYGEMLSIMSLALSAFCYSGYYSWCIFFPPSGILPRSCRLMPTGSLSVVTPIGIDGLLSLVTLPSMSRILIT